MNCSRGSILFLAVVVCFLLTASARATLSGDEWRPVDPAERAMKASTVEKDADAEALFWEVRLDDSSEDLILNHYIRIKIFTDRGKETQSKVQIPFGKFFGEEIKIKDIAARTIKADGTIVELQKDDVFESTQVKASGAKIKVKSFAVPGIEPGAIIEYRWREVRVAALANRIHLDYQREIPVERVTYRLRPSSQITGTFRMQMLNESLPPMQKEKDGFVSITLTNVHAFHEEPQMPPEDQVKIWMLVYYTPYDKIDPPQFWRDVAKRLHDGSKEATKVNDEVRRATTEAVGDASTPEDKLKRIFEYCRTKIKNVNDESLKLTPEQKAKVKENKTPSDTLKRGIGDGSDIDALFAAMCIAAGFDARLTATSNRGRIFFSQSFADIYFLRGFNVAVKVGDQWRFFDPATFYVPFGMLSWGEEGIQALLADAKEANWVRTPQSSPSDSAQTRIGKFKLSADGTLEGDVQIEFTGHSGAIMKEENDARSDNEREKELIDKLKERLSTAEATGIAVENVTDRTKPFVYRYHVKVPGYAERTGKRLFLRPGFFVRGQGPMFSANERKNDIYFHYPWSESDKVSIELPAGYALDNADAPAPIPASMTQNICAQNIKLAIDNRSNTLIYERNFFFGGGGNILFPVASYKPLKQLFDMAQQADDHVVTLKQTAAN